MARVIVRSNGWGNAIYFDQPFNGEVTGFMCEVPNPGDFLETSMQSKRTAVYQFTQISRSSRIGDGFTGKVCFVGYKDELPNGYFDLPDYQLKVNIEDQLFGWLVLVGIILGAVLYFITNGCE